MAENTHQRGLDESVSRGGFTQAGILAANFGRNTKRGRDRFDNIKAGGCMRNSEPRSLPKKFFENSNLLRCNLVHS